MKKFISMVMAAAMVVSLVPATAFAGSYGLSATASIVNAWEKQAGAFDGVVDGAAVPELKLVITETNYQNTTDAVPTTDLELTLDNADFIDLTDTDVMIKDEIGNDLKRGTKYSSVLGAADATVECVEDAKGDVLFDTTTGLKYANIDDWAASVGIVKITKTAEAKLDEAKAAKGITGTEWSNVKGAYVYVNGTTSYTIEELGGPFTDTVNADYDKQINDKIADNQTRGWTYARGFEKTIAAVVGGVPATGRKVTVSNPVVDEDNANVITMTFTGYFKVGDVITIDLDSVMNKTGEGKVATVAVTDGDFGTFDEMTYVSVLGKVLNASVKKTVEVAEEELVELKDVKVKAAVGNLPADAKDNEDLTIKISKGFEFVTGTEAERALEVVNAEDGDTVVGRATFEDEDEIKIDLYDAVSAVLVKGIKVEATTAKAGDVCTLTVYADDFTKAAVEVAQVVEYTVVMSVDEEADVPTFYNGVNVANYGLTAEDDHEALEVTIKETFAGAWLNHKAFTLSLPEGVWVTDVVVKDVNGTGTPDKADFEAAYIKGDHVEFDFAKRCFDETKPGATKAHEMTFVLTLVADPGFVGDVTLTLEGDAVDTQEVTIANVLAPFAVKAEQNDLKIDYRNTAIDTPIVVTEAEAGLWDETAGFKFSIDDAETKLIVFEDGADYTVNADSDMEIKDATKNGELSFSVKEESEEVAAEVTINGIELFMQRNIPAGAYELSLATTMGEAYLAQGLFAPVVDEAKVADVEDFSRVVKEAFINVVTAGREVDDASFTTKVLVPIGENTIYAGDKAYTLDVPAYINADGYTMLPVRAVAVALGISNDAVQWEPATKTVIVMYGQRFITMTAGQKVVYVSGTALPARSAVEIVDGRAFLGLRDLATALGVTAINYDDATKTASLN